MAGLNANTMLLMHGNEANGSQSQVDSSTANTKTITAVGNAQASTADKKFGSASLLYDGNGDYHTIPSSADFEVMASATQSWTIDCWIKLASAGASARWINLWNATGASKYWSFEQDANGFNFIVWDGSGVPVNITGTKINDTNWHHVCLVKKGAATAEFGLYQDGTQTAYGSSSGTVTISDTLYIGARNSGTEPFNGYLDEVRIQKENYFNASPNSGLTDTITVPTSEYSASNSYTQTCTEVVTVVDTLIKTPVKVLAEVVTVVDTVLKTTSRLFTEVIIVVDTILKTPIKVLSEVITVVDTLIRSPGKVLAETVTVVDSVVRAISRAFTETVIVVDTALKGLSRILPTETITVVDSLIKTPGKVFAETITLVETFLREISHVMTETVLVVDTVLKTTSRLFTETVTVVDNLLKTPIKVLSEVLTVVDSLIRSINHVLSETVTVVDTLVSTLYDKLPRQVLLVFQAGYRITLRAVIYPLVKSLYEKRLTLRTVIYPMIKFFSEKRLTLRINKRPKSH